MVAAAAAGVLGLTFLVTSPSGDGSVGLLTGGGQNSYGDDQDNDGDNNDGDDQDNDGDNNDGDDQDNDGDGEDGEVVNEGPVEDDFVDIEEIEADNDELDLGDTGTFTVDCGVNANGLFNSENVIVNPGAPNGAQHVHDYVGNQDVNRFSEDVDANNEILAQGNTTCDNNDRSMHYWPVLRDRTQEGRDANQEGGGLDGNVGRILTPLEATIEFRGNAQEDVVPMPEFLQIITGNARAFTTDGENANAQWTCTGFEDQISGDKYPLCPEGSDVMRIMDFPSCWDGENIESEDNRSHIVFPDEEDGSCPDDTQPVPQLRQTLVYDVPEGPNFAVDGFPEEQHAPITDHSDFINVMPEDVMQEAVDCINEGQDCS
ncbi:DUF1996 domain-containing protein [Allosalinactinospora lopnorensis]|uniref:DUF1996 domain-containing protein n=1 Tax=Allosalinactinospora lopnorensis TaxID=1352348 RepID=UPI000623E31F|nr:DUF1996 domain-containing protein [Allosalinactinospora lopnorensis]